MLPPFLRPNWKFNLISQPAQQLRIKSISIVRFKIMTQILRSRPFLLQFFSVVKKSKIWSQLSTAVPFKSPAFRSEAKYLNLIHFWTASLCTWPPGCSPLVLLPSQGVGSVWASLSLVGCRCTSTGVIQEKRTVLAGHLKHTDTMPFKQDNVQANLESVQCRVFQICKVFDYQYCNFCIIMHFLYISHTYYTLSSIKKLGSNSGLS